MNAALCHTVKLEYVIHRLGCALHTHSETSVSVFRLRLVAL